MKAVPFLLLCASNAFMTMAWYGHLKWFQGWRLLPVIFIAWAIALPEYALQVPANRIGHTMYTTPQLKIVQEAISVAAFVVFSILVLKETPRWTDAVAFLLIFAGLGVALLGGRGAAA